ncbi:rhodanese-like domain-containing protein [Poseidonibacter ostreae]|jgi:rhodanese-related sulfurtransferase|uniref:Rhodanese-like domain-containing protein n=1 Tax=Poseidonibacter ostreae TaxID=2654171 RepID=A0A6L4WVZ1_9BACT|nr:rhodanese-like domain-containing protein [Poseidonibacter ostreae]KAB7886502.1 rhodanese-like domain-containing protein [Poseidonibacter ostreae]KAB7890649.1 rhodanese-like domain-containing protein [Poseidonibacter ostreae]KAB7892368.1 rhodanese-like domain-containing protein [Poseidonibacter ostreae]MAC83294.1 rhodanese [Arcobacter sp.]|tara:strand:+ start:1939 stop:2334 length:396 start_codon:yes stop_codon:yes gene_type:complete
MNQIEFYEAKLAYETDSWDVFEALNNGDNNLIVIDARAKEAYLKEHIPNSINIPHKTMSEESTKNLDKNKIYVSYCDGIGCNASTKGALNLSKLGFKTKELLGGLDWWKRDGYETSGVNATKGTNISCGCN